MSRDDYPISSGGRSPGRSRRMTELQPVDRSPTREYSARGSPLAMGSPYYRDMDEPTSPAGAGHHRSRSASRPPMSHAMDYPRTRYQSLDRGGLVDPHDREFIPIREPRERSRDRSLERGLYLEDELYGRSARQSPNPIGYSSGIPPSDRAYLGDLQHQNTDLQRELAQLKRELELTNQKLGSSMHSIKTFWSPELKKERALRKEESAKYSLINDQLKLLSTENQKQAMLVRQLEEELRMRMRQPNLEMQQQMEALYAENDHLQREISILRETIKDLECRVETQKQTLIARDESMKKLVEMLQNKGMGKEEERQMFQQMQAMAQKQMYGGYNTTGSPPLPDIIGSYYTPGYSLGLGTGMAPSSVFATDPYGAGISTGYPYDPLSTTNIYGSISPIRRRRYSIAGLPSATMMNDYYGMYPTTSSAVGFGLQAPLQHASSSNLVNLLNETHKSISRSSQILNQNARLQQMQPITNTHYPGRVISSYPTLHPGGEVSPPYLSDTNLLQMSNSFSSQPNMYFQPYTTPTQQHVASGRSLVRPAYSVSSLNNNMLPSTYASRYATGGVNSSTYPYSQSLLNHSDLPYILQQRQLLSSLHASNPAISQYYQQQLPQYLQHYAQQSTQNPNSLAYNLQQQFAGTQHYQLPTSSSLHPSAHIHYSVAQQLNPNHQFHVHAQQNHMQSHPLAALANTSAPFGVQLTSSDNRHDNLSYHQGTATATSQQMPASSTSQLPPPTHHHHHPHIHHPTAPHTHHPTTPNLYHHSHHHPSYSKLDLEYPKMPQEHKRQVSFKFDVDQLSLDS